MSMLETFFITVNQWLTGSPLLASAGSFLWGMISVLFSPCHLASIPLIVAYVGGQEAALKPRQAAHYAIAFTLGLFITIAVIGIVCAFLGRMLGDVGNYWQILVGLILFWVALGMMGVEACSASGSLLYRLNLRGIWGAFGLGLAYGVLSGSCTFGFIAPILGDHYHSAESDHRHPFHHAVCPRSLPSHRDSGQFHGHGEKTDRKSDLAGGGFVVPQRRRGTHRCFGDLFYRQSFLGKLNERKDHDLRNRHLTLLQPGSGSLRRQGHLYQCQ